MTHLAIDRDQPTPTPARAIEAHRARVQAIRTVQANYAQWLHLQRQAAQSAEPDDIERLIPAVPRIDLDEDEPWRADAICREVDPEIFFPEKGGSTREAKLVCAGCPVRVECLDYALRTDQRFGVFGGLSERQRRGITRMSV